MSDNPKKNSKKLPKRKAKTMSVVVAKRMWFAPKGKGRPSKEKAEKLAEAKRVLQANKVPLKRNIARKNPIGRPKKPKIDKPSRPRGRPRTSPKVDKPSRPRGRPRKHPKAADKPKLPRGRPRKHPKAVDKPKRPRGRPRKNPSGEILTEEKKNKVQRKKRAPKKPKKEDRGD